MSSTNSPQHDPDTPKSQRSSTEGEVSEHGLELADILLIRERLAMTPTERLRAAQRLINAANRIRAEND